MTTPAKQKARERAVLLGLLALVLFATPSLSWWLVGSPAWYLPYLLWLVVIALAAWQSRRPRTRRQDHER